MIATLTRTRWVCFNDPACLGEFWVGWVGWVGNIPITYIQLTCGWIKNIEISGNYEDIFDNNISTKLIKMLEEMYKRSEDKRS